MANQKLQVQRALAVVPSDTIGIPDVAKLTVSSVTTSASAANKVEDTAGLFTTTNLVSVGDIVYNATEAKIATVLSVDSATVLTVSDNIMTNTDNYSIYRDSTEGCILYIGTTGNLKVLTSGDDIVTYTAVAVGFFPVHVKKVFSTGTGASTIVANW
jgi:hypothetical protein